MTEIEKIIKEIEGAVNDLSVVAEAKQKKLAKELESMLKDLQTNGDALLTNVANLKKIYEIKAKIEALIIDDPYKAAVKQFAASYKAISGLQNDYFSKFNAEFTPKPAFEAITRVAVDSTINGLTDVGIEVGVTDGIKKILLQNINSGGSYSDLTGSLRDYVITDSESEGALSRYVRTYATTAINQYSAEYNKAVSEDLGLEWFGYDGSLLTTSRPFCVKMVAKEYVHLSEFEAVLAGDFGPEGKVRLNLKTGLPEGLMDGTDPSNLIRRRGGWNCGHQMIAVAEAIVPKETRDLVYESEKYKEWAKKNKKKTKPKKKAPAKPKPLTLDEAHAFFENAVLAPHHEKAVKIYTGSSYDPINKYLRGIDDEEYLLDKKRYDTTIKDLGEYLNQAPKVEVTTYRGVRLSGSYRTKFLSKLRVGEQLIDDGFMSTSYELSNAENFSKDCVITVIGKSGVLVEHQSSIQPEQEVLFNRGKVFTIKAVNIPANGRNITVTMQEED